MNLPVLPQPMGQWIWPLGVGTGVFVIGLILRWMVFARLGQLAARTRWKWDDLVLKTLKGPSALWCFMAAVNAGVLASPASPRMEQLSGQLLSILWLLSVMWVALRLADQLIQQYGTRLPSALPLTSLTQNITKGVILILGSLTILNNFGVSITPMLTALGVGGLAVALALQDSLAGLFSGVYITVSRQIRVGDYVKLESGEEGYVADIAWRSTRIQTLSGSLIVVPNTKLAQTTVTNHNLPNPEIAVLVEVGVEYSSDFEKVERITAEVGKEIMAKVPGGVPAFEPFIRCHTLGDSSVRFTVILRARSFVDQYLVKHEFIKRLLSRYAQERITIPFPTQTVVRKESD